jgi:hypothetical protein
MTYIPQKAKRQYQRALWEQKKNGKDELVAHDCAKCRKSHDGEAHGVWFERSDTEGVFVWVCEACCEKRHNARANGQPSEE